MDRIFSGFAPLDVISALLSQPVTSVAIAMVIGAAAFVVARRPRPGAVMPEASPMSAMRRYAPESRALRIGGTVLIAAVVAENLIAIFVGAPGDTVSWWRYTTPLLSAAAGLLLVLVLVATAGAARSTRPVAFVERRTWTTFTTRRALLGSAVSVVLLATTVVVAGLASSPDRQGRYVWLVIPVPNSAVDPLRLWFFGWAYGIPVLICLLGVATVTVAALHGNAVRPFLGPETVRTERRMRSRIAAGTLSLATAATMFSLASAWRFIASAGATSRLSIEGDGRAEPYEVTWRFAEFAIAAGWMAPILEVAATLLILVAIARLTTAAAVREVPIGESDALDIQGTR